LSEAGLGPKLHGVFDNGRIEEYIPSHTLNNNDLLKPEIRNQIARKLAKFHSLDMPFDKKRHDKSVDENYAEQLLKMDLSWIKEHQAPLKEKGIDVEFLLNYDFKDYTEWMAKFGTKVGGRNVFCIRDLNRLNCLIRDVPDRFNEVVTLIDYELADYSPRGLDLANFFNNWLLDISSPTKLSGLQYPPEEIRREFLKEYLNETKKLNYFKFDENGEDSLEHLMIETDFYVVVFALYLALFFLKKNDFLMLAGMEQVAGLLRWSETLMHHASERRALFRL
jgi:choline/ethanolamine kinase